MPRTLYTVAVVSERLLAEVMGVLEGGEDGSVVEAERLLYEALGTPSAQVAFYRVLMDGWNRTHVTIADAHGTAAWRALASALDERWSWVGREKFEAVPREAYAEAMNAYAIEALSAAMVEASEFAKLTGCGIVVLCRVLYAAFGDEEFRAKV